ncbi:winged helix-turn-helix transcriptional regulator [Bradyrhizobium elkanii]|uniref:winged helix-turn-helix transcriptional regulator n=1 Tax=Bradyrhizobium elkanii TaxID=29448 RepID=UPI00209EE412|nr:helix-turn-helix domain-containing protein [Bradyrhizobium elkanii]MCP1968528.1 DNA-binding HxlR family transcriptional regulator [Bradyrhizobium elkanii]MCS4109971.1 DNA-binding HxlR family transcriptional regulator [Bradyrhizobium elkanii]
MSSAKQSRLANKECSVARAMELVGDRWSILILREAYYGVKRFDEFELYVGIAPNILSTRLKKLVSAGIMRQVPLPEHSRRYEYVLTEKGRDFFPAYLALKKWGDDWLADPAGPQVVFRDCTAGHPIKYPEIRGADGEPLRLEDVEVVAGAGAVPFNRNRFGGASPGGRKTAGPMHSPVKSGITSRQ